MPNTNNNAGFNEQLGVFKDAWANGIIEAYKGECPLLADAEFRSGEMVGGRFHFPVRLTAGGGATFAPSSSAAGEVVPGYGGRPYIGPNASVILDAALDGMQTFWRSRITYEAIARSAAGMKSPQDTDAKKAVRAATLNEMSGASLGLMKKLEALMLHGQQGLGFFTGLSNVVATSYQGTAGFAIDLQVSEGAWARAIFLASERHGFDVFADSGGLPTGNALNTALNTIFDGENETGFALIAIEPATNLAGYTGVGTSRVLRLWHSSGTAGVPGTGVIGGWTTPLAATLTGAPVHICFTSGGPSNEFAGLMKIASNTGTLFGLSAATYSMWKGNLRTNFGAVDMAAIARACTDAIDAGAPKKMRAVLPTACFAALSDDQAALRIYKAESTEGVGGMKTLKLYLPMGGELELLGHNQQKQGSCLVYAPGEVVRVGATDLDFVLGSSTKGFKSMPPEAFALEVNNLPAKEVRLYGNFAPFAGTPAHMTVMTGCTY